MNERKRLGRKLREEKQEEGEGGGGSGSNTSAHRIKFPEEGRGESDTMSWQPSRRLPLRAWQCFATDGHKRGDTKSWCREIQPSGFLDLWASIFTELPFFGLNRGLRNFESAAEILISRPRDGWGPGPALRPALDPSEGLNQSKNGHEEEDQ